MKLANTPNARKAKAKEIRQQILADIENNQQDDNKEEEDPEQSTETLLMNEASDTERSPSAVLKKTTAAESTVKEKRKSISFAPPVVWNITDDTNGPRPDPPSNDEIDIVSKCRYFQTTSVTGDCKAIPYFSLFISLAVWLGMNE